MDEDVIAPTEHYRILDEDDDIDSDEFEQGDLLYLFGQGNLHEVAESIRRVEVQITAGAIVGDELESLNLLRIVLTRFRELFAFPGETYVVNSLTKTVQRTDYCALDKVTQVYLLGERNDVGNWRSSPASVRAKVGGLFDEKDQRALRSGSSTVSKTVFRVFACEVEEIPVVLEGLEALVKW